MRPDPLLQLSCIGLDPAEDGGVIDRDAAVLQHEREIAIADREHQIPAHRPEDHLGSELPALEHLTLHRRRPSPYHPAAADYAASWPAPKLCNRAIDAVSKNSAQITALPKPIIAKSGAMSPTIWIMSVPASCLSAARGHSLRA